MSYAETNCGEFTRIEIECDARINPKAMKCTNKATVTTHTAEEARQCLWFLGWGLVRGHQVCRDHSRGKVVFPRTTREQRAL